MRITQTRDQLEATKYKVNVMELVNVAFNGFTKYWEPFVKGICAPKKLPYWQRLWVITSRKRLERSPKQESMEVVMRTSSLSVRQEREKERVPTRRVTMRGKPHSQGRRT
jgi:hypothetical protein